MYEKKIPEMLDCGLSVTIKVLGGKWKAWILDCLKNGMKRPSELHREITEISPRVINLHLKELEDYGVISKKIYAELPLRVEYFLTQTGKSIIPVMDAMEAWGNQNRAHVLGEPDPLTL